MSVDVGELSPAGQGWLNLTSADIPRLCPTFGKSLDQYVLIHQGHELRAVDLLEW